MMNLLTEPVFRVETTAGREQLSLPGLLAVLGEDRVESLPGIQRHQEDAFHIFLCYLAGAVLARAERNDPQQSESFWRDGIRRLTRAEGGVDDSAWTLVVEDPLRAAFLQPPMPKAATFTSFKPKATTPNDLDLLPTAKNHDVKSRRSMSPEVDAWTYALISLQTMSGFFGQGNYGIARMNGGFASRPVVGLVYDARWGGHWKYDTTRLLRLRSELLAGPWSYRDDGRVLTWLVPWDLQTSLALSTLDPFFIEIARAVRLTGEKTSVVAFGASSKIVRIAAKDANGVLGDPWIPINRRDAKKGQSALTVGPAGLTPELVRNLVFEDGYDPAAMQLPDPESVGRPCSFIVSVLIRGQGTTDGFQQTAIPIPAEVTQGLFHRGPERDRLARLSKEALNDAGQMQNRVLKPAVLSLLEAGPDQVDFGKRELTVWWEQIARLFAKAWSAELFPWLWRAAAQPRDDAVRLEWLHTLRARAEEALIKAVGRYPSREGRRYRARVRAEGLFRGAMFRIFPELKEIRHDAASHG